jgi:hypothetical protein
MLVGGKSLVWEIRDMMLIHQIKPTSSRRTPTLRPQAPRTLRFAVGDQTTAI